MKLFKRDLINNPPKNKDVWHYTCENGHTWVSRESPGGGVFAPSTTCPECYSTICKGDVYRDGNPTGAGACHMAYGLKSIKKEKMLKKLNKEVISAKVRYGK